VEKRLIKKLMTSTKCTVCGQHYEVDDVSVLGHHEDLWFLSVFCSGCQTQCLVAAVVKEGRAPHFITDLTEEELERFRHMPELTSDEMLDMQIFLKDFNGDFARLFD